MFLLALSLGVLAVNATASSAESTDAAIEASLGTLRLDQSKSIFDAVELTTAECMGGRGFEYLPNQWISSGKVQIPSKNEAPQSANSDLLAQMTSGQQLEWHKALIGEKPRLDQPNPSRTSFSVNGATMSVDLNSCSSKARSMVLGDEVTWMKALMNVQQLNVPNSQESRQILSVFEGLQRQAVTRAQQVIDAG